MAPRDLGLPARMTRIAVVAPTPRLRETLVALAGSGGVELVNPLPPAEGEPLEALRRLQRRTHVGTVEPRISGTSVDPAALERDAEAELLAGEVELKRRADAAVRHRSFAAFVGWAPADALEELSSRLRPAGAAVVELPTPPWTEPPTLLRPVRLVKPFRPLVDTYGASRYADVDPTPFAAFAFVLMFGMMFGDVGHGLLLVLLGLVLRRAPARWAGIRGLWPLPVAAGATAAVFGLLYGEAFGPTGLVPTLWLDPIERPIALLVTAAGVGAFLLAGSYVIGTVNRWRGSGLLGALVAPSGAAGFAVFLGGGTALVGFYLELQPMAVSGAALAVLGVVLLASGFVVEAGRGTVAVTGAAVEVVEAVVRIGANAVSFTRLAAFGLMHAALGQVVFDAAAAAWGTPVGSAVAIVVFVLGNALAFTLEALVAGVQALRLEYYELFSRIFAGEGRAFSPWSIPVVDRMEGT